MIRIIKLAALAVFSAAVFSFASAQQPESFTTETGIKMILIPGGWFEMGRDNGARVRVDSFYMSAHPVTQEQFERIMGTNPSRFQNPENPVERITWAGAAKFCNELSGREGLRRVYDEATWDINYAASGFRLPSEAEWEYAARAGTDTDYFWGGDSGRVRFFGWIRENAGGRTRPVGRKLPNPHGLYDIYGNVWEWCNDYYRENYTDGIREKNPGGPAEGEERVVRGGAWDSPAGQTGSFARSAVDPGYADICTAGYDVYGFRIVKNAE